MEFYSFEGTPGEAILTLHERIFGSRDLQEKLAAKPPLLISVAEVNNSVVGYKIGYRQNTHTFYSWLGGVNKEYRGQGIARRLMEEQHRELKARKYTAVETKTMNQWKAMLVLNIQQDFKIYGTHINHEGEVMIMLRKTL